MVDDAAEEVGFSVSGVSTVSEVFAGLSSTSAVGSG